MGFPMQSPFCSHNYTLFFRALACQSILSRLSPSDCRTPQIEGAQVFETQRISVHTKRSVPFQRNRAKFGVKHNMSRSKDRYRRCPIRLINVILPDSTTSPETSNAIDSNTKSLQLEIKNVHNSLTSQIKGVKSNNFNSKFQNEIDIFGGQVGNVEMTVDAINEKTDMLRNNIEMQRKVLEEVDTNVHILWNTTQELQESDYYQENKTDLLLEEIKTINRKIDNNEDNVKTNVNNLQKLVTTSKIILSKMEDNSSLIESITNARTYVSLKINDLHGSITEVIKVANNTHG
ncbi:unnamed protein product [Meganyctiphanes norvegica]|uniref:Uncharacterized protein n=1 Tax=Meganyctiphanes norvegica TaxID=48144 RepID=A0AAV2QES4_MEGNR